MKQKIIEIQLQTQIIIDLIVQKNANEAQQKLVEVHEQLDELIDFSDDGDDLIELSRFQVLLNHLQQKIVLLKAEQN